MPRPRSENPTPSELEVLQIIWRDGPCTVRQMMNRLNSTRKRAYTSVMSLMNVMVEKKLLTRKPRGKAFLYSARIKERPMLRKMVADLMERAFDGSAGLLVAHALEQAEPTPEELQAINKLIDDYRSRMEKQSCSI